VQDVEDINEESLSLFTMLEPKLGKLSSETFVVCCSIEWAMWHFYETIYYLFIYNEI